MNYLGLTVFAGNTPGLIIDFDPATKEYVVEFTDGRIVNTSKVYWDNSIAADKDTALYRQSSIGNGEQLVFDIESGWDVVSAMEEDNSDDGLCEKCGGDGCPHCDYMGYHVAKVARPIEITNEPSDLGDWVDDYTSENDSDSDGTVEEKLDEVLDTLNELVKKDEAVHEKIDETDSAVQQQDHDATEDSYWDRSTKPNPMAYDEEFPSGQYNERNPGTLNPTARVAKKECDCWDGYKRVPGTEPCAPGSCEKCDEGRKKESAAKKKKHNPEEAVKKINRVPPEGVRANARRALKYIEEGKAGDGFQDATADRARRIAAGEELTEEHINRMHSFFERHAGGRSKKAKPGEITAWDVAWLAWGGDSGRSWAAKVDAQLHKARHPNSKGKHSADSRMYWETGGPHEISEGVDFDDEHMRSDIGGNSNVRHAEGEAQKNQHGDEEGNPEMRGVGDPDVYFPEPPLDVANIVRRQTEDVEDPNEEVWEKVVSHAHVREEAAWEDSRVAGSKCPTCSDPLVNGNCYVCGENKAKEARVAEQIEALNKIANSLKPRAAELGFLFGEALAGKTAVTEPSEGIYAIEIHGVDSHPENSGTGNYNRVHGDSPEYLKDVNHGGGGWIDPTPEMVIEGMPRVIEYSESDKSAKGDTMVEALEKFFDEVFGDLFKENKEKGKKKKESSIKIARPVCNICKQEYVGGECALKQAPANCPAENSSEQGNVNTPEMSQSQAPPMGYTQNQYQQPSGVGYAGGGIPGAIGYRGGSVEGSGIVDVDENPIIEGQTYRLFAGIDDEPDIVKVTNVDENAVEVVRIDSSFPENEGAPYKISTDQFGAEDIRFYKVDELNPNEVGADTADALAGTPEVNDDAGPGHNNIPGQSDLSRGDAAAGLSFRAPVGGTTHEAGRHYYPNQQKEFINEPGNARNLDKLILDGTHYVEGETTASEHIDDDFLFGI